MLGKAAKLVAIFVNLLHGKIICKYSKFSLSLIYHLQTQEFLAHGRQTLAELKDKLYCLTDKLMVKAGQQDSSGYFLIEVRNSVNPVFPNFVFKRFYAVLFISRIYSVMI